MNPEYQREMMAFEEKIALAKLEESKASERVRELEYQKARFSLDFLLATLRAQQEQQQKAQQEQKV